MIPIYSMFKSIQDSGSTSTWFSWSHARSSHRKSCVFCCQSRCMSSHNSWWTCPVRCGTTSQDWELYTTKLGVDSKTYHISIIYDHVTCLGSLSKLHFCSSSAKAIWLPSFHLLCNHSGTINLSPDFFSHNLRSFAFKAAFALLSWAAEHVDRHRV